jgi:hypothetical protein
MQRSLSVPAKLTIGDGSRREPAQLLGRTGAWK